MGIFVEPWQDRKALSHHCGVLQTYWARQEAACTWNKGDHKSGTKKRMPTAQATITPFRDSPPTTEGLSGSS